MPGGIAEQSLEGPQWGEKPMGFSRESQQARGYIRKQAATMASLVSGMSFRHDSRKLSAWEGLCVASRNLMGLQGGSR